MTEAAMQLITPVGDNAYDLVGRNVCTGDHKVSKTILFCVFIFALVFSFPPLFSLSFCHCLLYTYTLGIH